MITVTAGDRLVVTTEEGPVAVRALRDAELVGPWRVEVLAPLGHARARSGVLEVAHEGEVHRLPARLALVDGALVLCAGRGRVPAPAPPPAQRREDVRGELHLPVRSTALDSGAEAAFAGEVADGHTVDVSGGGARLDLRGLRRPVPAGARLYAEFELPGGDLAPVVLATVQHPWPGPLHARFLDVAPRDRERIVRLVFEAERSLLVERRDV
jgi:PilZ domain-containing protein